MRVVRLEKGAQGALLGCYTSVILAGTLVVQGGKSVQTNLVPFGDLRTLAQCVARREFVSFTFMFLLFGITVNVAMFAVWGFLAWRYFDEGASPSWKTTLSTIFAGAVFSTGIETVQFFLPTRAADVNDVFWNVVGTALGAGLSWLTREVSLEWSRG